MKSIFSNNSIFNTSLRWMTMRRAIIMSALEFLLATFPNACILMLPVGIPFIEACLCQFWKSSIKTTFYGFIRYEIVLWKFLDYMVDLNQRIASLEGEIGGYVTKLNDATTSEARKDILLQTINIARETVNRLLDLKKMSFQQGNWLLLIITSVYTIV